MRLYTKFSQVALWPKVGLFVAVALVAGTILLLLVPGIPGPTGDDWANRGQAASTILAGFALFFSIIATMLTARLSSSDFRAAEDVKADTMKLLASLRSIQVKCAWLSQNSNSGVNFVAERKALTDFLNSTTASAYWTLVGIKGEAAAGTPEGWRIFFLNLVRILQLPDAEFPLIAKSAIQIENLITSLNRDDMRVLAGYVSDLLSAVGDFKASRSKDTLLRAMGSVWGEQTDISKNLELFRRQLIHLKTKGIHDPNVELWIGITAPGGDPEAVKAALGRGADRGVTDTQLLEKYREDLRDFANDPSVA